MTLLKFFNKTQTNLSSKKTHTSAIFHSQGCENVGASEGGRRVVKKQTNHNLHSLSNNNAHEV